MFLGTTLSSRIKPAVHIKNIAPTTAHMDGTLLFIESFKTPPKRGPTAQPMLPVRPLKPKYLPRMFSGDRLAWSVDPAGAHIISAQVT